MVTDGTVFIISLASYQIKVRVTKPGNTQVADPFLSKVTWSILAEKKGTLEYLPLVEDDDINNRKLGI